MADWTLELTIFDYTYAPGVHRWQPDAAIPSALIDGGSTDAILRNVNFLDSGNVLVINFTGAAKYSFTNAFETAGQIEFTNDDDETWLFKVTDAAATDTVEPYRWTFPANSAALRGFQAFRDSLTDITGTEAVTAVFWDGQGTSPFVGPIRPGAGTTIEGRGTLGEATGQLVRQGAGTAVTGVGALSEASGQRRAGAQRTGAGTPVQARGTLSEADGEKYLQSRAGAGTPVQGRGTLSEATGARFTDHVGAGTPVQGRGTLSEATGARFTDHVGAGTPVQSRGTLSEATGTRFTDHVGAGTPVQGRGTLSEATGTRFTDHVGAGTPVQGRGTLSEAAGRREPVSLNPPVIVDVSVDDSGALLIRYSLDSVTQLVAEEIEYRVDGGAWQPGEHTRAGITPTTTTTQDMTDDFVPADWTDDRLGVDEDHRFEYCSSRHGSTGNWGKFGRPALVGNYATAGLAGEDGLGVEYIFTSSEFGSPITGEANLPDPDWNFDIPGLAAGVTVGAQTYFDGTPSDLGDKRPYRIRFRRPVPGTPAADEDIGTVPWKQEPAVRMHGIAGLAGEDGLGVEYIFTSSEFGSPITGEANLPDPDWNFDIPGLAAGVTVGAQTYFDGTPSDLGDKRPYRIRFRRPVPGTPAADEDIGTVPWKQEPAVRVHGIAGLDGSDGGEYEYVFCATALGGTITGSANLPDPDWKFDEPNLGTTNGIPRGANKYYDGTPGDVSATKPFVHRFKRRVQGFPAANSDIGRVTWEQETAFRYWAVDGDDGTGIQSVDETSTGITVNLTDGNSTNIAIKQVVSTQRNADTGVVTVSYSDGTAETYNVPDGAPGNIGDLQIQRIYDRTPGSLRPDIASSTAAQRINDSYTPDGTSRSYTAPDAATPYAWVAYRYGISGSWTGWTDWSANGTHASVFAALARSAVTYQPVDISPDVTWSDQKANDTTKGSNVITDIVTQVNPDKKFSETRYWDGNKWVAVGTWLSGNYFFDRAVGARKLDVENLSALNVKVQNADIQGTITADHISSDVINVETLWEGSVSVTITATAFGAAPAPDTEDITLDTDIDTNVYGSLLVLGNPVIGVSSDFTSEVIVKDRIAAVTLSRINNSTLRLVASSGSAGGRTDSIGATASYEVVRILGVKGNPSAASLPSLLLNEHGDTVNIAEGESHTFAFALSAPVAADVVVSCALRGQGAGSNVSFQANGIDTSESVTISAGSTDGMITVYGRDHDAGDDVTLVISTTSAEIDSSANSSEATIEVTAAASAGPGAPRSVSATVGDFSSGSDDNDIRLSWAAPSDWGTGAANTRMFELRLFRGGSQIGSTVTRSATTTSYDFEVLDNGTYSVDIRATTDAGNSARESVGSLVVNVSESATFTLSPSSDQDIEEGDSQLFTIRLSSALSVGVTFDCDLTGDGAASDVSFSANSAIAAITRTIAAGATTATFRVYARDDDSTDDATLTVGTDSALITTSDIDVDIEPVAVTLTETNVYTASISIERAVSSTGAFFEGYAEYANIYGHTGPLGSKSVSNRDSQIDLGGVYVFRQSSSASSGSLVILLDSGTSNSDNTFKRVQVFNASNGSVVNSSRTQFSYTDNVSVFGRRYARWARSGVSTRLANVSGYTVRFYRDG